MDTTFKEIINQLILLEETTDSSQGILFLIIKNLKSYLSNETIREAIKECNSKENWTHPIYGHISNWKTLRVTNMESLFYDLNNFNQVIGNWDTSKVINMESMFESAYKFNQVIGILVK